MTGKNSKTKAKAPAKKAQTQATRKPVEVEGPSTTTARVAEWKKDFVERGGQILRGIQLPPETVAAKEAIKVARDIPSDTKLINTLILEAHKRLRR